MADEGWPIFAEWRARQALPWCGGNNIPDSYLNRFNAETQAWLDEIKGVKSEPLPNMPDAIGNFLEGL